MQAGSIVSVVLSAALLLPPPVLAQQSGSTSSQLVSSSKGSLKIIAIQGEGAVNNVRTKSSTPPVVEVRDAEDKPVAGAEVVFHLPAAGPGGVFNGWMRTQTARTNEQGQAGASGFTPNDELGRFNIKVTASNGAGASSLVIAQINSRNSSGELRKGSSAKWKIIGALGAAAVAGGVVAATRGGSSAAAPSNPVTVTPGQISVGGPR